MRSVAFAALLLWAAPAVGQAPDQLYRDGVAARQAGDNSRAVDLLARVVAAQPGNSDARLQHGLALLALGRLDEAEAAFRGVLAIAPDYADARIGLARIEQRRGNLAGAQAALAPIAPGNSEADALRLQLARGPVAGANFKWRVDLDGSYSALTGNLPDWKEGALRVTHQADPGTAIGAGVEVARRFGITDVYGEVRLDRRVGDGGSFYVLVGATPKADFRPEWQVGVGGGVRVRPGPTATVLTLDARQAHYQVGDIQTLNPGIEQYLAGGRAWITARWINVFDEDGKHSSGWLARGDLLATDRLRIFAGAADAPDTSEGTVIDTFSLFGGFAYDVSDRTTLRASLAHEDRDTGYDRVQFGLGAGFRF